jgi:hypothetical protein
MIYLCVFCIYSFDKYWIFLLGGMSSSSSPRFLDQGAYGCIHRPPLRCRTPSTMNYTGKVSKLISNKEAKKELGEYVLMDRADPDRQFYLGKPETCPVGSESINQAPIQKCDMGDKVIEDPDKYQLILMKDGGMNWQRFANEMTSLPVTETNCTRMEEFWIETHRMLLGIRTFLKNDIVHHDVKAPNMVYDTKKYRMNYIDFGLMETCSSAMAECKRNEYEWNRNWWYFPFESILLNKENYTDALRPRADPEKNARSFIREHRKTDDWFADFIQQTQLRGDDMEVLLQDFVDFMKESSTSSSASEKVYEDFLRQYFNTLDIYGLGIACLHVLDKTGKFMSNEFIISAKILFLRMICFHPMKRITIDALLDEYEHLLESTGIAEKHHIVFDSSTHTMKRNTKNNMKQISNQIIGESKKRKRSTKQLSIRAEQDPIPVSTIQGRRRSERLKHKREKKSGGSRRRHDKTKKRN